MIGQYLDIQMQHWASRLAGEIKLPSNAVACLATTIANEIRFLSSEEKSKIKEATPIPLTDRLNELKAFQSFMEESNKIHNNPALTRAQVIVQNYICFVYLPESCFRVIARTAPRDSALRKCAAFLSNNPVRAFRNAIAHANWCYRSDFKGIVYWAKKGDNKDDLLEKFEADQENLYFWQALSRCVAYVAYSNLQ